MIGINMNDLIVKRIRETRLERQLTQQDLANCLGRTAASISDLERGKVQVSANDLQKLASYLNKPIEYFYGEEYTGDDVEDLISIIRRLDPEIRSLQIPAIKSIILVQQKSDEFDFESEQNTETIKSHAKEVYKILIPYLLYISELKSKGLEAKTQLEEILGIGEKDRTRIE